MIDAAPEDEELLAQEGVLGDEGGSTAHEIGECIGHHSRFGGFRCAGQALPERASKGSPELGTTAEQARQHHGTPYRVAVAKMPHTPVARSECSAAARHVKRALDSNGYPKRPTHAFATWCAITNVAVAA